MNIIGKVGVKDMSKQTRKTCEDFIRPFNSISNGMILLNNGEKVTGVKIAPKNIFILDYDQQQNILNSIKNMYNQMDFEFWLIVADRPVDISVYLSDLQVMYNQEQNPAIRKLIAEDINKGNSFMNNNVVDTEYYILFKEKKMEIIQKRLHNLISGLVNCGLNSQQVSNGDLRMLLDNFFNDGKPSTFGTVMA